tara:strand:- start:623 stop:793 length:171 start_codon:yes stop_codon:yes gene_type:complete
MIDLTLDEVKVCHRFLAAFLKHFEADQLEKDFWNKHYQIDELQRLSLKLSNIIKDA